MLGAGRPVLEREESRVTSGLGLGELGAGKAVDTEAM